MEVRDKVELLPYRDLDDLVQLCIRVEQQLKRKLSYPNFTRGPLFVGMRPSLDHLKSGLLGGSMRCCCRQILHEEDTHPKTYGCLSEEPLKGWIKTYSLPLFAHQFMDDMW